MAKTKTSPMVGYAEALSSKPKFGSAKKELHSIEIEKAENGGHIVRHRFEGGDGPYHSPESHAFGADEGHKLLSHLKEHLGIEGEPRTAEAEESEE